MEKPTRLALLFCTALCMISHVSALTNAPFSETVISYPNNCDIPAPGNFRVESRGFNFIDLAWNPVSATSQHTLFVYTRTDSLAEWEPFGIFYDLPGASFFLEGVGFEHYCRLVIATNCGNGEPSSKQSVLELPKIILDLITPGRIPVNPVVVDCHNININAHEWVGFKVVEVLPGQQVAVANEHLFEFGMNKKGNPQIKRVHQAGAIVASDDIHEYPFFQSDIVNVSYPFLITKPLSNGNFQDIGRIYVTFHENKPFIDICIAPGPPKWNNTSYAFSTMVAETAEGRPHVNEKLFEQQIQNLEINPSNLINLNNPFREKLILSFPESVQEGVYAKISMSNISGQVIFEQKISNAIGQVSIETNQILPGIYFVKVEDNFKAKIFKVIKAYK